MKDVFTHYDSARVGMYKSLLEEAGISCYVRNETSTNLMTGVPVPVFYPTLCVVSDADYDRAQAILKDHQQTISTQTGEWICPNCQSVVPAGFETCWNCEREKPAG